MSKKKKKNQVEDSVVELEDEALNPEIEAELAVQAEEESVEEVAKPAKRKRKAKKPAPSVHGAVGIPNTFFLVNDKDARKTKERLLKEFEEGNTVNVYIPLGIGEKSGPKNLLEGAVNGVGFGYQKGLYYDMPRSIAMIIMDALQQTTMAGQEFKSDNTPQLN